MAKTQARVFALSALVFILAMIPFAVAQLMYVQETHVNEVASTKEKGDIGDSEVKSFDKGKGSSSPPKESEVLNMKIHELPKVTKVEMTQPILPAVDITHKTDASIRHPIDAKVVVRARKIAEAFNDGALCSYEQTKYALAAEFDCTEGVKHLDVKETSMYTSQYKPAVVEAVFDLDKKPKMLRIVASAEFPKSQSGVVYYKLDDAEAWKVLATSLNIGKDPTATYIPLEKVGEGKKVSVRVEGYLNKGTINAHEGSAIISINSIEAMDVPQNQWNDRRPTGNTHRPVDPTVPVPFPQAPQAIPPSDDGPSFTLAVGSPLVKAPGTTVSQSTPETSQVAAETNQQAGSQDEDIPQVVQDTRQGPTPVTGAAVGRFLRENRAGVGLLLLAVAVIGTMMYQRRKGARMQRRAHLF